MRASEIINKTNIVSLFESHGTRLKHGRGDEYIGLCPFHSEKHPSLSVNSRSGVYHCHACGASGNAYTFVYDFKHDKKDTIEYLKDFNGIHDDCDDWESYVPVTSLYKREMVEKPKPKVDTLAENQAFCSTTLDNFRANSHPYLEKKGIAAYSYLFGAKQGNLSWVNHDKGEKFSVNDHWLVAELVDINLVPRAYQAINAQGNFKPFIGPLKGSYFVINPTLEEEPKNIYICEGIATGLSIFAGDESRMVICCLSASQIQYTVRVWQLKYPNTMFRIMADNDVNTDKGKGNPGLFAALKAKSVAHDKKCVQICLPPSTGMKVDWNDIALSGIKITDEVIRDSIIQTGIVDSISTIKNTMNALTLISELAGVIPENEIKRVAAIFAKRFIVAKKHQEMLKHEFPLFYQHLMMELERLHKKFDMRRDNLLTKKVPSEIVTTQFLENCQFARVTGIPNITYLKSGLGTGKTQQLKKFILAHPELRIIYLTPRITLSTAVAYEMGITDYQDIQKAWKYKDAKNLSIVINSIYHIANETYDIVIIDESEQILRQLTSNLIGDKKKSLSALAGILSRASNIVLADAHLSDISMDFISRTFQGREIDEYLYLNQYKPRQGQIMNVYQSDKECFQTFIDTVKQGKKVAVMTNTLRSSYAIESALLSASNEHTPDKELAKVLAGKNIRVINGDNSTLFENRMFMKDFDKSVQDVDVLIMSPSITSGVSNHTPHFDAVFGFFRAGHGLSTPQDCMQQIARIRYPTECHVFYEGFCEDLPVTREQLLMNYELLLKDCFDSTELENSKLTGTLNPYVWLYLSVKLNENLQKQNARQMFFALARHEGFEIKGVDNDCQDDNILKKARALVKEQETNGIMNARDLTSEEYESLKIQEGLTRDDRHAVKKFQLKAFFDVQNNDDLLGVIKAEQRGNIREAVNFQVIRHTDKEVCKEYDKFKLKSAQDKWAEPHFRSTSPIKSIITQIESAFKFSEKDYTTADSPQIQKAVEWFTKNHAICAAHGFKYQVDVLQRSPIKVLSRIAAKLGFTVQNKIVRLHRLARVYWLGELDEIIARAIKKQMANELDFISRFVTHVVENVIISNTSVTIH